MESSRWLDEREARAWSGLQMMQLRLDGELARRMAADSDLRYDEYVVMAALTARPGGRLGLAELGAELGWERSRLARHLKRMTARGLLRRESSEVDRRGKAIVITAEGVAAMESAAPGHLVAVRELFINHLADEQLDVLGDIALAVLSALDAAG